MPFVIGETIGPYRLVEQLGQGGMATVYKAYHPALDRYVAIKVLHLAFMEDSNFLARFRREARVVARLDHPNIVPIYDFAEHEGRPYLVMKFVEGETLKARLERGLLTLEEMTPIVDAVGAALAYAHRQNILHRDVKPSNVLLARDGQVYLADFGLARMAEMGESSLTADRMVGTPQYMSPEQAMSKPDLDARSDIYSLGVLLYEVVTGRVPFNADTPFAVIHDHIYSPLPPPRQINPQISEAMERVLLKTLAKNPDDRFQDVSSLVHAFDAAALGFPVPAEETALPLRAAAVSFPEQILPPSDFPAAAENATLQAPAVLPETAVPAAAQSGSVEPPRKKKKASIWLIGCLSIVLLTLTCLILSARSMNRQANKVAQTVAGGQIPEEFLDGTKLPTLQAALNDPLLAPVRETGIAFLSTLMPGQIQIMTATASPSPAPEEAALILVDTAIQAARDDNMPEALRQISIARQVAGKDQRIYAQMYDQLIAQDAWLLAAALSADLARNDANLPAQQLERIHQVVYMAAGDENAGDMLQKENLPLLQVARLRYELYHGNEQSVKPQLDTLLKDPLFVRRFPEARLLEAEVYREAGESEQALKSLQALLELPKQPQWVKKLAADYQKDIK